MKRISASLNDWKPAAGASLCDPLTLLGAGWADIVGADVAASSRPTRIGEDGILLVTTRSGAWSQQLGLLSERVLGAINARFSQLSLRQLRFRVGRIAEPASPASRCALPQRSGRRERAGSERAPAATADEAVARFRASVGETWRAKAGAGWKQCERCGSLVAPGARTLCTPCENAREQERSTAIARLLFEAPWLGFAGTAALVDGLTIVEYEAVRRRLLARWWTTLSRAREAKKLSRDNRERLIASSYVLLKSQLAPEDIAPATLRSVLGDDLHDLIYETE